LKDVARPAIAQAMSAAAPFSAVLDTLARGDGDRLSMEQALAALEDRSFGGVLLLLTLVALCLPPGLSAVPGTPLLLIGLQMLLGRDHPWLPRFIRRRSMKRSRIQRLLARGRPWIARIERVIRPRLARLTRPGHLRLVGLGCAALSLYMIVPVPLLHGTAGWGLVAFAAGLLAQDGLALLAGWALTVGCGGLTIALVVAARLGLHHLL
jgi:hypothetical protein